MYKRGTTGELTPHSDGWYYLTMSYRVTWHPLDDPTMIGSPTSEAVCSTPAEGDPPEGRVQPAGAVRRQRGEPVHGGEGGAGPAESVDGYIGTIDGCDGNGARDSVTVSDPSEIGVDRSAARCQHRCRPQIRRRSRRNHEEDDAPDPADKTEEELNEDIDRILEEVPL
jgi:hypothetical protein